MPQNSPFVNNSDRRSRYVIQKIAEYVMGGRADSMKAALDLLEEDIHRQQMVEAAMIGAAIGAQSRR